MPAEKIVCSANLVSVLDDFHFSIKVMCVLVTRCMRLYSFDVPLLTLA